MGHSNLSFRNRPVPANRFAMNPAAHPERATFTNTWSHKTTLDAGYLVPIYVDEVYPGDSFHVQATMFGRLSTMVVPPIDDLYLESFYFFVPWRLVWTHWPNFMGERSPDADSSISYTVPLFTINQPDATLQSLAQYMGIPTHNLAVGGQINVNAGPFRAYYLTFNEWFRDQDLQNKVTVPLGDGPDTAPYVVLRRGKMADYFTKARPWPQKGTAASISLAGNAPVSGIGLKSLPSAAGGPFNTHITGVVGDVAYTGWDITGTNDLIVQQGAAGYPNIQANLTGVSVVTINALREAEQIQVLLERDARGGTRLVEIIESHWGVRSPDQRMQRPEYLGGGSQRMGVTSIPQTSETGATPLGELAAAGTVIERHGFSGSFVEHGYIIGLVNVRSTPSYQQGIHPMWSRSTRYDFAWPEFTHLGEQPVYMRELFLTGFANNDLTVFGYQERYAELRYHKSLITGMLRSGIAGTLDQWHFAQEFSAAPVLASTFIEENPPMARVLALGEDSENQQVILDAVFSGRFTRALPAFGVPSLGGRF